MKQRLVGGVVVGVLVAVAAWWLCSSSEPEPAPREAARPVVAAATPPAPVPAIPPAAVPDAGATATPVEKPVEAKESITSSVHYLQPGNVRHQPPTSTTEFQLACTREAEACAKHLEPDASRELPPTFELTGEPGHVRITGVKTFGPQSTPPSPFATCLRTGLEAQTFTDTPTGLRGCVLNDFWAKRDRSEALVSTIARCVGPDSEAEAVSITTSSRVVDTTLVSSPPQVSSIGRLDLSAESCIRAAVGEGSTTRLTPAQAASRGPERHTLTVVLASTGRPRFQPLESGRLRELARRFKEGAPTSLHEPGDGTEAAARAEAALTAGDAGAAREAARSCLAREPELLRCHRTLSLAWLRFVQDEPQKSSFAAEAWVDFVRRAPADDPDALRVRAALARVGLSL